MKKNFSTRSLTLSIIAIFLLAIIVIMTTTYSRANFSLSTKLSGRILLQVEDYGQAWYVNPENEKKYYLGTPEESFLLSRQLGFYMDKNILNNYLNNSFPDNYSGRVIINAQETYEAYYINPLDLKALPLNSPQDAFNIMRDLSLGITNEGLKLIKTYNYLDNDLFSNEIIDSTFDIEVLAFEPNKMKDFTRIVELSAKISNPQNRRILERGLVWDYVTIPDVSVNPTLKNNYQKVLSENNSDVFTVKISDLVPGSYPFFRAYVITEDNETIYSNVQAIQGERSVSIPLIPIPSSGTTASNTTIISAPKFILNYGAGSGGDIDGPALQIVDKGSEGQPVIAKASPGYKFVKWSDNVVNKTRVDSPVDSNVVVVAQFELVCPESTVFDEYWGDRFTYDTVAIGEQCWLKQNSQKTDNNRGLLHLTYRYNNSDTNKDLYGLLYPGVFACPLGWHVPSKVEWEDLISWISLEGGVMSGSEGKALKANTSLWSNNTGTDDFGFSALPGGRLVPGRGYRDLNTNAYFWTSTKVNFSTQYYIVSLEGGSDRVSIGAIDIGEYNGQGILNETYAFSTRCIRD